MLTAADRRALEAEAHNLEPVVHISAAKASPTKWFVKVRAPGLDLQEQADE